MVQLAEGETFEVKRLLDTTTCAECHGEIAAQWKGSMHHRSSFNNPFYQDVFDRFVADNGRQKGRFCGGCHDTALMFDDTILAEVRPEDPKAHAGISCAVCHGVTEATTEGNASYTLTTSPIPLPKEGDEPSLVAHRARVGMAALRSDALCASCHIGFISADTGHAAVVTGLNEYTPWRRSGFNGSKAARLDAVAQQRCVDCHMPMVQVGDKQVRSHRFAGGHAAMASMTGDTAQLQAIEMLLKQAARLDVIAVGEGLGRPVVKDGELNVVPGSELAFDVVVINENTGHKFPGGALDLRDTWIEVDLTDASGAPVAAAGAEHERTGEDLSAHRLRALVVTEEGKAVLDHRVASFRTPVYDNSIPPRSAAVVRYTWAVPADLDPARLPLTARVRLRHRRLQHDFQATNCKASTTPRGKAFLAESRKRTGQRLDPCATQPVIDIAEASAHFGTGAAARYSDHEARAWWLRQLYRGIGLEGHVQERLQEAQDAFEGALTSLGDEGESKEVARVRLELGKVKGKQGRTDEAARLFDEVQAITGEHPAVAMARGEAFARVWRWKEAAAAFEQAARLAPQDDQTWRELAIARGSAGDHRGALEAAQQGLRLEPRDPYLLRSQMLAFQRLAPDSPETASARTAFLAFERDEKAPSIQSACSDASPDCWLERLPVHSHSLQ